MARGRPSRRGNAPRARGGDVHPDGGANAAFQDMLAEVESSPAQTGDEGRPIKKRRVRGRLVAQGEENKPATDAREAWQKSAPKHQRRTSGGSGADVHSRQPVATLHREQTAYKDESSDESEFAWEEVGLGQEQVHAADDEADNEQDGELQLVLADGGKEGSKQAAAARRKPLTAIERSFRLQVHKVHLLCLLSHVHMRNHWCNDQNVHNLLYRRLPKQIVSLLNPDEKYPEFRQDESFKEGLKKVSEYFREAFTITARGMSRPYWVEDSEDTPQQPPSDLDLPMQKSDFVDCAKTLKGSRDIGIQLLCALLRSANVETRLVCSLQVLPLTGSTKGAAPPRPPSKPIPVIDYNPPSSDNDSDNHLKSSSPVPTPTKRPIGSTGGLTRFSNPNAPIAPTYAPPHPKPRPKKFRESPQPIFWVEVLNPISERYTPIDVLVTRTIGKPSALAPSLSDPQNSFAYVIAFNDDLTAKDVTRRYTSQYAAKILRQRVDSTATGKAWLASVLKLFRYPGRASFKHELAEDDELAKREASEPMPRAIQDFKNHPTFALERHLRRNEIIHPRKEVGRVNTAGAAGGKVSSTNSAKSESVFRRKDVLVCRSADAWFRLGRSIEKGEQPLKRLPAPSSSSRRARRSPSSNFDHEEDREEEEEASKPLYAPHQTNLYIPPPVPPSGHPLPRNPYNNLDLYTPSMLPARAHHSRSPHTALAATILGIDHVPAVTGFVFRQRRGQAVVEGGVVWEGHAEAVEAVVEGLEEGEREREGERRRRVVLGVWGRWVRMLRVRERVRGYEVEGERGVVEAEKEAEAEVEGGGNGSEDGEAGGFLPERGVEVAVPTAAREGGSGDGGSEAKRRLGGRRMLLDEESSEDSDAYVPSDGEDEEVPAKNRARHGHRRRRERSVSDDGSGAGGFVREDIMDDADVGGGFIPDDGITLSQGEDDDMGGGFIPDEHNHEYDGKEEDIGGGFIIEDHATISSSPPSQPAPAPEEEIPEEEIPEEKPLELSKPAIVPSQAANQHSQSSDSHLDGQTFGPIHKKNVSSFEKVSTTAKEEEPGAPAFRAEEVEEKLAGDVLGLSDVEIVEAAVVEKDFFELKARGVGPSLEGPTQENPQEMDDRGGISAGNVLEKDYSELRAQNAEPSSKGPAKGKPKEMDGPSGGGGAEIGSPKNPLVGRTAVGEEVGDGEVEVTAEAEEEEEADDQESLLSADPSDQDAEPEWLA